MEVKITHLMDLDCCQFSDSIANSGLDNIGKITWDKAMSYAEDPLVTPEQQTDLRDWIAEFGAWTRDEIRDMSDNETNALLLQFVAGEIRERESAENHGDLDQWEENFGGRIYKSGSDWYYYVGC